MGCSAHVCGVGPERARGGGGAPWGRLACAQQPTHFPLNTALVPQHVDSVHVCTAMVWKVVAGSGGGTGAAGVE